jgi:hypothetical protein
VLLKRLIVCIIISAFSLVITACDHESTDTGNTSVNEFLIRHWPAVLPPQGNPPASFSALEASLAPQSCGTCHAAQYAQWKTSLHAHTMGPGIQWQLQLMSQQQGNKCLRCHAPLAEQKALVALQQHWPNRPTRKPPSWVPKDLADDGLVCAGCHVRHHQRFGPPPRKKIPGKLPHGGFTASKAFQDSRFCAACHQHQEKDNPPRINGKLLVDTWEQWQKSPQARKGVQCQNCHMPDRQHLWRGIHDAKMTRSAVDVNMVVKRTAANTVNIKTTVHNIGAGHYFPTYMVPKVTLIFSLRQRDTGVVREFYRYVIGWKVNTELTKEQFDTRIPAGESRVLNLPLSLPEADAPWEIDLVINVDPDEHYERTFGKSLKEHADQLPAATLKELRRALSEDRARRYRLLEMHKPVPPEPIAN